MCSLKPVSRAPVRGLKEFPHTGGLSIRDRNELPSWLPGQSIIPAAQTRKAKVLGGHFFNIGVLWFHLLKTIEKNTTGIPIQEKQTKVNQLDERIHCKVGNQSQ